MGRAFISRQGASRACRVLPRRLGQTAPALASADVNGDGVADVFVSGARGQAGVLYLGDAAGNFTNVTNDLSAISLSTDAIIFDFTLGSTLLSKSIPFDLGIDALDVLGFEMDGAVELTSSFSLDVGIGVSRTPPGGGWAR